jgi:hypothetical protein
LTDDQWDEWAAAVETDDLRALGAVDAGERDRGITRLANNPVADIAQHMVATRLGLDLAPNTAQGYDAVGPDQERYPRQGENDYATEQEPADGDHPEA